MDLSKEILSKIVGDNKKFINPYEAESYYIWTGQEFIDDVINEEILELYYEKLKYAVEHVDILIEQAFQKNYYDLEIVNKTVVKSAEEMRAGLYFDSWVMVPGQKTIGGCLCNDICMWGHFIDAAWDYDWNLVHIFIA